MNHRGGNETKKKQMAHQNPIKRCLAQPGLKRRFLVETIRARNIKKARERERDQQRTESDIKGRDEDNKKYIY